MQAFWREWLYLQRAASTMEVERKPLSELVGWAMGMDAFGRTDGRFFSYEGCAVYTAGREVPAWEQPLTREVGTGVVLLISDGGSRFLISARTEPGNPDEKCHVLLGAPLQASLSNLQQAHGGKKPPRAEFADSPDVHWVEICQDGGKYVEKINRYGLAVADLDNLELLGNERIFSRQELRDARDAGEINSHLAEALSLLF